MEELDRCFFSSVSPSLKDRRDNSALAVKLILFIHVNIKLFSWLQGKSWRVSIDICFTGRVTRKINVYLMFPFYSSPNLTNICSFIELNASEIRLQMWTPLQETARDLCSGFQDLTSARKLAELSV